MFIHDPLMCYMVIVEEVLQDEDHEVMDFFEEDAVVEELLGEDEDKEYGTHTNR